MLTQATQGAVDSASRPIGIITPNEDEAVDALRALKEHRIDDAEQSVGRMAESSLGDRAWKTLLTGLVTIEKGRLKKAEPLLLQASGLAFACAMSDGDAPNVDMMRLTARALMHVGWIYRRNDRCVDASRVHLASHRLCEEHGSHEELWECATELALDADVARQFEEGERWHRAAIESAESVSEEPLRKQAIGWTNLSTSRKAAEKHEEAVAAARTAQQLWHRHDPGAVTAAKADAKLGEVLLRRGERLCDGNDPTAAGVLGEAVRILAAARDALLAFGPDYRQEAQSCRDQQDFATRLDASVRANSPS